MSDAITFLKNFVRNPTQVGAIAPSSSALAEMMVDWFDWDQIRNVVEFGPGTGVFTEAIERRRHPDCKFLAIERSPELVAATRARCPGVTVVEDSATRVGEICQQHSIDKLDAVLCGLPWASFPDALQREIIDAMLQMLGPGGKFATFAYWQGVVLPAGIRFSRLLNESFSTVQKSPTVWRNLPPAFVYRCTC
ncbi:MAG: methyltransferase domain-containing protein [Planctomycetota bacterium]